MVVAKRETSAGRALKQVRVAGLRELAYPAHDQAHFTFAALVARIPGSVRVARHGDIHTSAG
jgi:hypothetical protein